MAVQRICTMEDKPYLRALWQSCFGDSDSFLDYYFEKASDYYLFAHNGDSERNLEKLIEYDFRYQFELL